MLFRSDEQEFINKIINHRTCLDLEMTIESQSCNGDPEMQISLNGQEIYRNTFTPGQHIVSISVPIDRNRTNNQLAWKMLNKQDKDTIIDNSGTIIQDKNIRFVKLSIDNCILSDDDEFFYSTFGTPGLWSTDALKIGRAHV